MATIAASCIMSTQIKPKHSELTVAAHVHCMKLPLVVQDQHISASIHQLGHAASLHNVFLLPNEMGGRRR